MQMTHTMNKVFQSPKTPDRYRDFEQSIDLDDIDIGDIKQEIKRILSEHGVWSDEIEKTFRLYSIMDIR